MKKNLKSKINQTVNAKIMEQKVFKTAYQEEQEAKDMAIYNEWNELMSVPGQSATGVTLLHFVRERTLTRSIRCR